MRTPLEKTLRSKLEKTVEKARDIVEVAVTEALTRLGIGEGSAPSYLSESERKLRTRLRAHGRQLGDVLNRDSGKQEIELLVNEMTYEHWHRMLFARFLEQSDLLMYDQNTHVTLDECFELAEEGDPLGDGSEVKDGWDLAGRLAQKMLPQIFRTDSPVFDVKLSINHVHALEELIADLHPDTFQASDALGWCYQFWQNKKKKQVNESGVKIGAKELSPVTQLFTEPYMVSFLLDNALGAWWAKRRLTQDDLATATNEQELRNLASIPGVPLEYLRFVQDDESKTWQCAAGDFDKWPDNLSEFKTLDPCCGSGHFLVAKFLMLVPMRMELERLTAKQAIDKVIAENVHGLELDLRCVELAAFALALEAWRYPNSGGYRQLPELQLACSGVSIVEAQKEWKDIAKDNEELQNAVKWMQKTFKYAPSLGSLIKPTNTSLDSERNIWDYLKGEKDNLTLSKETQIIAQSLIKSAELLCQKYEWVTTNVPFKETKQLDFKIQSFIEKYYPEGKTNLATAFIQRLQKILSENGVASIVSPHEWLFLTSYKNVRKYLLERVHWSTLADLGEGAFESNQAAGAFTAMITFKNEQPKEDARYLGLNATKEKKTEDKKSFLKSSGVSHFEQRLQLENPDHRIGLHVISKLPLLNNDCGSYVGLQNGDTPQFVFQFWEITEHKNQSVWEFYQLPCDISKHYNGLDGMLRWEKGIGILSNSPLARIQGVEAWSKHGVAIRQTRSLPSTLYLGNLYDQSSAALVPKNEDLLNALWCFTSDTEFHDEVRKIDQKKNVTNATLVKIPFDESKWQETAKVKYPNGLPQPYSNDLTQWIFHGHPCASVIWSEETKTTATSELRDDETVLQVAVARLLGYRWPAELDKDMELAPEMREVIAQNKVFDGLVDDDGIVCIPAIRGEKPAVDRLEAILHAAYGDKWSATLLNNLLKSVKSRDLNIWLRDKFFEQHCKLFQHRPFIWHIWDGLPDGFSALVNYHQLDYKGLERLIYTYLDDWISTQIQLEKDGDEGAEIRLAAARNLRKQLEEILIGEKGLDIFVRWKSLAEQPIGWNPDLNDGVRLNIRPFMKAKDVGKKDAGILRSKPNIHWKKDRGTDVESAPWYDLGLEYGGKQGDRINDHHLTLAEKKAAKEVE
ncbi:Eco57I restriction-modification methylase domain-containing protein [Pseudoalteromonas ruthenica]|uniref:Eco57I restriction-modification methylase domain-containing protein n=1 Tax=Pseudoalteromonas ruthenica TaxID=151081 RepID=UPI00241F8D5D|nr:N-6 DNA methylase [Pseudoalteromonas ruthenica]|tara:strand:+ start:34294 stop:37707 length:3414 start_codon:yes stop_codon:yes gene_type:complete